MTKLLMQQAIDAIQSGDKQRGRELLAEILKTDRNHEQAWLWLTKTDITREEKIKSLKHVLRINPDNDVAKSQLAELRGESESGKYKTDLRSSSKWGIVFAIFALAVIVCVIAPAIVSRWLVSANRALPILTPSPVVVPTKADKGLSIEVLSSVADGGNRCVTVEGEVKNTSADETYPFMQVIVSYYDKDDSFLSTDTSYIEYNSLSPGQVSPFKVFSCFDRVDEFEFYKLGFKSMRAITE